MLARRRREPLPANVPALVAKLGALATALVTSACVYMEPDGADWHKTRKVSLQVCVPGPDRGVRVHTALQGRIPIPENRFPPNRRSAANEAVFFSAWDTPSNAQHSLSVRVFNRTEVPVDWRFAVPAPSDYKLEWSDWILPMGVDRSRMDAPRVRHRLEYPREQGTDKRPIPSCA
jgi:hypothetical protein